MAQQNIYDNEIFFDSYKKLRERAVNANTLFEIPVLFSLLPDLKGKRILDLGCGFGDHCKCYVEMGAEQIVGIDISEKMLDYAKAQNSDPKITYLHLPMEDTGTLEGSFDLIVSSLAIQYVEAFSDVVECVYEKLAPGGYFIFSQENPLTTCHRGGDRYGRDENGKKLFVKLANYGVERENEHEWFVDNVKVYHRMFSTIVNALCHAGFIIERMEEPLPSEKLLEKYPDYDDLFHKPDFLIIKAKK